MRAAPTRAPSPTEADAQPGDVQPGDADLGDGQDHLLAAAERCLRRSGIRRTTMTEVAAEAGISRAWLYRQYPNKPALVLAVLVRADQAFWAEARHRVSAADGLAAQVAEAVRLSRSQEPAALLLELSSSEPHAVGAVVGTGVGEVMPGLATFWHEHLEGARRRGEVRADLDVSRAAEWVMRIVISLVSVPSDLVATDDPVELRRFLDEFLVRGLR
jgi:AcrR family transcriptional regulator